jgi:energy-coupling factor transporter ATPase
MTDPLITATDVEFTYAEQGRDGVQALCGVSLRVFPGEHVAIIGPNGSGKSTLARLLNALLLPTRGRVCIAGMDTRDATHTRAIRQHVGMVFQHPESQMVATIVEEDVAFGPENLGIPHDELHRRVRQALDVVGMWDDRGRPPHLLSAGQKQRVAIAGVIAMRPAAIVLDEATSMLDPRGREEVHAVVAALRSRGTAIVTITHLMEEAVSADRIVALARGAVLLDGTPRDVFSHIDLLREVGLDLPPVTQIALRIRKRVPTFPAALLTVNELVGAVAGLARTTG